MKTKLSDSNPANYGLAAKAWECLRRNEIFRGEIAELRKRRGAGKTLGDEFRAISARNLVAALVVAQVIFPVVAEGNPIEDTFWQSLPYDLRKVLEGAVESYYTPMPRVVTPPTASATIAAFAAQFEERDIFSMETLSERFDFVAIPKAVRDTGHRKKIIDDLEKRVPISKLKKQKLESRGCTLGAAAEWEIFLFVEQRLAENPSRQRALEQAAWKFYKTQGVPSYIEPRDGFERTPEEQRYAKRAYNTQSTMVWNRHSAIKEAIKSVYPSLQFVAP